MIEPTRLYIEQTEQSQTKQHSVSLTVYTNKHIRGITISNMTHAEASGLKDTIARIWNISADEACIKIWDQIGAATKGEQN